MGSHDGLSVRVCSFSCRDCFLERLESNLQLLTKRAQMGKSEAFYWWNWDWQISRNRADWSRTCRRGKLSRLKAASLWIGEAGLWCLRKVQRTAYFWADWKCFYKRRNRAENPEQDWADGTGIEKRPALPTEGCWKGNRCDLCKKRSHCKKILSPFRNDSLSHLYRLISTNCFGRYCLCGEEMCFCMLLERCRVLLSGSKPVEIQKKDRCHRPLYESGSTRLHKRTRRHRLPK